MMCLPHIVDLCSLYPSPSFLLLFLLASTVTAQDVRLFRVISIFFDFFLDNFFPLMLFDCIRDVCFPFVPFYPILSELFYL